MSQIINLRTRRKQATRDAERAKATHSATRHGLSAAERALDAARRDKAARDLDGHRREDET